MVPPSVAAALEEQTGRVASRLACALAASSCIVLGAAGPLLSMFRHVFEAVLPLTARELCALCTFTTSRLLQAWCVATAVKG